VFQLLDDATDNVKGVSCYVLEMFCENLQPATVLPFLPQLMNRLVQVQIVTINNVNKSTCDKFRLFGHVSPALACLLADILNARDY
jgi:hypothetical protein